MFYDEGVTKLAKEPRVYETTLRNLASLFYLASLSFKSLFEAAFFFYSSLLSAGDSALWTLPIAFTY